MRNAEISNELTIFIQKSLSPDIVDSGWMWTGVIRELAVMKLSGSPNNK